MAFGSRYGARRQFANKPVLPVITVVCDDTRTAVAYFALLKHEVKGRRTVAVFAAPHCGADAEAVFALAKAKRPKRSERSDHVFVIIDLDTNRNIEGLRRKAAAERIQILASLPCYEVWTLAHLQDTGEAFQDCYAVLERIHKKWKELFDRDSEPRLKRTTQGSCYCEATLLNDAGKGIGRTINPGRRYGRRWKSSLNSDNFVWNRLCQFSDRRD